MCATVYKEIIPLPSPIRFTSRRRDGLFSLFLFILAIVFLWTCRLFGPLSIQQWFAPAPLQEPVDLLLLLAAVLAAMLVHEVGHLLASVLLGFQVLGGTLGPMQIQVLPGTSKFSWSLKTFFTGSVSAVPRSMGHWRAAMMAVAAAGPIATLASAWAAATLHPPDHAWFVLQVVFLQVSALLFFLGLIPNSREARQHNDARILLDLMLRNKGCEELELKVLLKQQVLSGVRPEDYPHELLARLAGFEGRSESRVLFAQALVHWAVDSGEIELADIWDQHAFSLADDCGLRMRNSVLASSACFDVIFRRDLEAARSKFEQVDFHVLFPACFEQRARAANQIALGRLHRAPAYIIRAQYALPRGIAYYTLERSLLAMLHMIVLNGGENRHAKTASA